MKQKAPSVPASEYETCVLCHCEVPIPRNTPLNEREFYVAGAGQLCLNCYRELQPDAPFRSVTDQIRSLYHVSESL